MWKVFPAQAGVILSGGQIGSRSESIPRASGGDPYMKAKNRVNSLYSPRKRG